MLHKIFISLLFTSVFCIQSADCVKCPKFAYVIPARADQDVTVKYLKKSYLTRFRCTKHEVNIIKSERDLSKRESLQGDPIIKRLIEVHKKNLASIPHAEKLHQIEMPYGSEIYSEAVVRILENGRLCKQKNEIIRAGEEFVALYNQYE